jgi:glucokinase
MHFIGIDIGGTKVSVSIGTDQGEILASKRVPTEALGDADSGLGKITDLIQPLLKQTDMRLGEIDGIGVGAPGAVDIAKGVLVHPPNLVGWDNTPIVERIYAATQRPVFLNNDANGWALAEYFFGACKGLPNIIILTNSTGMGGGLIINHRLLQGASDMAGEVGHMVIDNQGPGSAGLDGTFEGFCGGLSLANQVRRAIKNGTQTRILDHAGGNPDDIDFKEIREAYREGDVFAKELWQAFVERFAQGIGMLLMALNPNAVILGTIAIHSGDLLMKPLMEALPRYAWPRAIEACTIAPSRLEGIGDLSALSIAINAHREGRPAA